MRFDALVKWLDEQYELEYQSREQINPGASEDEDDCWRMHDLHMLRLQQLRRALMALKELVDLKDAKALVDCDEAWQESKAAIMGGA